MSILIKGMEMPKDCCESGFHYCHEPWNGGNDV